MQLSANTVSYVDRTFSAAAPKLWNSVPYKLRTAENSFVSYRVFFNLLQFFNRYYFLIMAF